MIERITEQPFCQTRVSGSTFVNADCFDVFPFIEDKSIDAIICDLPYGTTACKWDSVLPFDKLWKEYERIIKPNGAIVLFSSQPFTTDLINSNRKLFKYEIIWDKIGGSNFQLAKVQPLKRHENILVFGKMKVVYNPQMKLREKPKDYSNSSYDALKNGMHFNSNDFESAKKIRTEKYPDTIIEISGQSKECNNVNRVHSTQKPLELMEYLIKTYTNEGETVLDNCMGSGTTNLACIKLNRKSIGIENEKQYYDVAVRRASEYCH
jgi:site-specific DNA-methyltransferase (adenine-specific)